MGGLGDQLKVWRVRMALKLLFTQVAIEVLLGRLPLLVLSSITNT